MLDKKISNLGLSNGEIKVYLALLKHGPQVKYQLAIKSGVSTSKIYEIISKLSDKGLVSTQLKDKKSYCVAKDPKFLEEYIEKKEKKIQNEKKIVKDILPKLRELEKERNLNSTITFEMFEGDRATTNSIIQLVKKMDSGNTLYSFGARNPNINLVRQFHRERVENNINLCSLYPKGFDHSKQKSVKLLKSYQTEHNEGFSFYIFDKKIILLAGKKNPTGIIIDHPKFHEAFKGIFEELKNNSKEIIL